METTPYYRIRQLILEKYGEKNFALGYSLVARWLSFYFKQNITVEKVELLCNATNEDALPLTIDDITALQQLFKIKSPQELFTTPENFLNNP